MSTRANHAMNARLFQLLALGVALALAYGIYYAARFEDFLGYTIALFAAIAPVVVWIQFGAPGIPIFPTSALLYWIYYGLPALRGLGEAEGYSPYDVLVANITVALFLGAGTIGWAWFLRRPKGQTRGSEAVNNRGVLYLAMIGLGMGVLFYFALYAGLAEFVGSAFGVIRAVLLAPTLLACYLMGYGKAKHIFTDAQWFAALLLLCVTVVLQIASLLLIGGVTEIAALIAGYVYTAKQIPWITCIIMMATVSILQAGKAEMRDRYANISISIERMPTLFTDWFQIGMNALTNKTATHSVADRASLLPQLIRVQLWTPDRVPFLNGETYTYMPAMLVPRIINPDRSPTQIVMNLLDVRYGFLSREQTKLTAVGVNIVPEAYANFGYIGVVLVGFLFGVMTGFLSGLSIDRGATALPTLLAIATTVTVIDLEADLSYLVSVLFQSFIAISVFYLGMHFLFDSQRKPKRRQKENMYLKEPL